MPFVYTTSLAKLHFPEDSVYEVSPTGTLHGGAAPRHLDPALSIFPVDTLCVFWGEGLPASRTKGQLPVGSRSCCPLLCPVPPHAMSVTRAGPQDERSVEILVAPSLSSRYKMCTVGRSSAA